MVLNTARQRRTHHLFETTLIRADLQRFPPEIIGSLYITDADLLTAFQRKFPDCDISYQQWYVESSDKVLKKGILVDWS